MLSLQEACKMVFSALFLNYYNDIQWEDQHETLSCDEFAAWKKDNDPELQAQGLAAYLNEEGIGETLKPFT